MSIWESSDTSAPTTSPEVRARLVEALKLTFVGPYAEFAQDWDGQKADFHYVAGHYVAGHCVSAADWMASEAYRRLRSETGGTDRRIASLPLPARFSIVELRPAELVQLRDTENHAHARQF